MFYRVNIAFWKSLGEFIGTSIVMVEISALTIVHIVFGLRRRTLVY